MKQIVILLVMVLLTASLAACAYATNPFTGKGALQKKSMLQTKGKVNPWIQPIVTFSQKHQKTFKQKLISFAKQMKEKPFGKAFWLFLWFAFLYGIFHALGPGHGKSIAISYFLSRPGKIVHGFMMGNLLTFSHVFSAVVLVMIFYFVFKVSGLTAFDQFSGYIKVLSAVLLMGVGVYLIGHSIHEYRHWSFAVEEDGRKVPDIKSLVMTSLVTGLIPCPGAAIILSYAILTGIVVQGLLAMIAVSLGMGLTTSSIALFSIVSRRTFLKIVRKSTGHFKIAYTSFSCVGASAIILIAIFMLVG
ncbi:hypothetical protein K8S19_10235 [bacterium]|nr:hypothetical protein [bacterium]